MGPTKTSLALEGVSFAERFGPELAIPVGEDIEGVTVGHHHGYFFAAIVIMVLNGGVDGGGVFEEVGICYAGVHIACAGEELVDIYAGHCGAEQANGGKDAESPPYSIGDFEGGQAGIGCDFAERAFLRGRWWRRRGL